MPTYPQINLNGTNGQELLEQNIDARTALQLASKAVERAYPNGRDYQTLPSDAFISASKEAERRLRTLNTLIIEYEAIAENISKQIDDRR